jgi:hypothetical protein
MTEFGAKRWIALALLETHSGAIVNLIRPAAIFAVRLTLFNQNTTG